MLKITHPKISVPDHLIAPKEFPLEINHKVIPPKLLTKESLIDFLERMNLTGMGGGGFPTAKKIKACEHVHTLIINAVECEPGMSIDQALLLYHSKWILAGAETIASAIGAQEIILATKNRPTSIKALHALYPFGIEPCSEFYPSGSEKIIIQQLTGEKYVPDIRPHQVGYLVQNVASVRAIGRALLDQVPVIERPLTIANTSTGFYENVIAPIGMPISKLLGKLGCFYSEKTEVIIASGLMMGKEVSAQDVIEQTTNSLFIIEKKEVREMDCTRCGVCNDYCPLKLHPIQLVEQIKKGKTTNTGFKTEMQECFLCGICATVCPSRIPLTETLKRGKQCLK